MLIFVTVQKRLTDLSRAISLLSAFLLASFVISFTREAYLGQEKVDYFIKIWYCHSQERNQKDPLLINIKIFII